MEHQKFSTSLARKFRKLLLKPLLILRNLFFSGLLVIVPLGITIWIVFKIMVMFEALPNYLQIQDDLPQWLPGYFLGFVLTVTVIALIGFTTKLYIGRKLLQLLEFILHKIPVINFIYKGVKQVSEQLVGRRRKIFERVALIEYPRKGIYSLAFVTSEDKCFTSALGKAYYVFVPTTPNPTSGYYLIVPESQLFETSLNVEDAMKMVISSGMVAPDLKMDKTTSIPLPTQEKIHYNE